MSGKREGRKQEYKSDSRSRRQLQHVTSRRRPTAAKNRVSDKVNEPTKPLQEGRRTKNRAKTKVTRRSMLRYDIVIDGYNVGRDYNRGKKFRVERIKRALEFFENIGKRPVAIISKGMSIDYSRLESLRKHGRVIFADKQVEHQRYHEYNVVDFAMKRNIKIVSNNMYRESSPLFGIEDLHKVLYTKYLIPYTFIKRRFLPNPSSKNLADETSYTPRPDHKRKKDKKDGIREEYVRHGAT